MGRGANHWFAVLFFIAFGGGLLTWVARDTWRQVRSKDWPSVHAELVSAGVGWSVDEEDGSKTYRPEVHYAYVVDGQRYLSNTINFMGSGHNSSDPESVAVVVDQWRERRDHLRASYDPEKPSLSCLEPGLGRVSFGLVGMVLFSTSMIAIGLWLLKRGPDETETDSS